MPHKICHNCNTANGIRAKRCKNCEVGFLIKKKNPNNSLKKIKWKELVSGDRFKVLAGGGPYFEKVNENGNKEKLCLKTEKGLYTVDKLLNDGIMTKCGKFIYMGKTVNKLGIFRSAHNIKIVA